MALVEAVTVELGSAIAKTIFKLWVKDSTLDSISTGLIDLFKSRTADVLAQRRAQRQFDTIGEKVGESLLSIFETEGARLDEGSRTAVALAVAEAFNKSKLSSELLATHGLEPIKLTNHILEAHPTATNLFNESEKELYRRIIAESCEYIIDIASQLPAFTERTFAEILKREDQILDRAEQVLQEVRRLREEFNPKVREENFELEYRRAVVRKLDVLEMFGTDIATVNRRHRLSVAYITLSVQHKLQNSLEEKDSSTSTEAIISKIPRYNSRDKLPHKKSVDKSISRGIIPVDEALARSSRLLIRGPAGSGKTTLLQWIAVQAGSQTFKGHLSNWNGMFPFYIRLRQCLQSGLPAPQDFTSLVAPAIADRMPKGWVHSKLESGNAMILIDGVDEVPLLQREDVRDWLRDLIGTYPHVHFVVTSRPHAVEEGWMDQEEFNDAELQSMGVVEIQTFIDHWHKAASEELREENEKEELVSLAKHLKGEIEYNRSKRSLATNPLLCAMLCALNRDRRQQLPSDRIEMYEACCSLLLERRDKERRIELADYPALNYRQKRLLVEDLAYWMIKNNLSEITTEMADERFARKISNMPSVPHESSPFVVRRLLVERTGIIREPVAGWIDFTHRTFQEFLAAKAASDETDFGILLQNADNDQWREVIILASGLATNQMRDRLIQGLINRGDNEPTHRQQLHFLAVSCFETSVEVGEEVKKEVEKRLNTLIPPKNMMDAKALASAGDLAVPYLAKERQNPFSNSNAIECIRTLALIGSDAALEEIEGYIIDNNPSISDELFRTWDSFDREIFAQRILSQIWGNREQLELDNLPSLKGFQFFTNLKSLLLRRCEHILNLEPLANLVQLTSLELSNFENVRNLSPLSNMEQLISLNLAGNRQVSDLNPLSHLKRLISLDLQFFGGSDLSPLASLKQLTSLNLLYCIQVNDLRPLNGMTQMALLNLAGCREVSDLTPLASMILLKSLDIAGCKKVLDLRPVSNMRQLESLVASGCGYVNDLKPLANMEQLKLLDLTGCDQVQDLSPLTHLKQLTSLNLSNCWGIRDLKPLTKLYTLKELWLGGISHQINIPGSIKERVTIYRT